MADAWERVKTVFKKLSLDQLCEKFLSANVDNIAICKSLGDTDLASLGLMRIGD